MECSSEAFAMRHSMRGGWCAVEQKKKKIERSIVLYCALAISLNTNTCSITKLALGDK